MVCTDGCNRKCSFSAQPRADGDEAHSPQAMRDPLKVSVLNREPMGMKRISCTVEATEQKSFSAQQRADGDEAYMSPVNVQ